MALIRRIRAIAYDMVRTWRCIESLLEIILLKKSRDGSVYHGHITDLHKDQDDKYPKYRVDNFYQRLYPALCPGGSFLRIFVEYIDPTLFYIGIHLLGNDLSDIKKLSLLQRLMICLPANQLSKLIFF